MFKTEEGKKVFRFIVIAGGGLLVLLLIGALVLWFLVPGTPNKEAEATELAAENPCPSEEPKAVDPNGVALPYRPGDWAGDWQCTSEGWKYYPEQVLTTTITYKDPKGSAVDTSSTTTETLTVVWSDADAFDARGTEYPMGDPESWTYFQAWDGMNITSTIHVYVAPDLVLRVTDCVGTRYQIWGDETDFIGRLQEMRFEVQARDNLTKAPPLFVVVSTKSLGASGGKTEDFPDWVVEKWPQTAAHE